ncbi:hypothetical protein [Gordonia sihwensis]|uniref:hypothetical protein n=1 Tax=Gordonia sihwensis TaxID=173559 RepID=UPI0024167FF8|nr:hypothetical protein [Gordonia sihwensis]WFN93807.1 hypothetical protein P5P27_04410 [Gordonia sihwensis]
MPLDPTPANDAWFTKLTESADFTCDWIGLNKVEYLAAQNPKIIDYYLRDGKERLQEQTDRLAGIISGRDRPSGGELRPVDVRRDLSDIYQAINEYDPHYRYEVSMTARPPEKDDNEKPGLVAVVGYGSKSTGWINISVFATSLVAMEERPIEGNLTIYPPAAGTDLAEEFRKFLDYGTPLHLPEGQSLVDLPLPGGLGLSGSDGTLFISSIEEDDPTQPAPRLVLGVLSPESETLSELQVERIERSQGFNGGYRTVWQDAAKLMRFEILVSGEGKGNLNVSYEGDFAGRPPEDVVDALEFWSQAHMPNSVGLSRAYGPREYARMRTSELDQEPDREMKAVARSARDLRVIQDHTAHRLLLPQRMTRDEVLAIRMTARILAGEAVNATWSEFEVDLQSDHGLELMTGDEVMVSIVRALEFELDGVTVLVGKEVDLLSGRVGTLTESKLTIEPIGGVERSDVVRLRFDGTEEAGQFLYAPLHEDALRTATPDHNP